MEFKLIAHTGAPYIRAGELLLISGAIPLDDIVPMLNDQSQAAEDKTVLLAWGKDGGFCCEPRNVYPDGAWREGIPHVMKRSRPESAMTPVIGANQIRQSSLPRAENSSPLRSLPLPRVCRHSKDIWLGSISNAPLAKAVNVLSHKRESRISTTEIE